MQHYFYHRKPLPCLPLLPTRTGEGDTCADVTVGEENAGDGKDAGEEEDADADVGAGGAVVDTVVDECGIVGARNVGAVGGIDTDGRGPCGKPGISFNTTMRPVNTLNAMPMTPRSLQPQKPEPD